MKTYIYSTVLIAIILLAGNCKKVNDSLSGRYVVAGKIFITDSVNGNNLPKETDSVVTVQLFDNNDLAYYIYETKTSGKGFFKLDYLGDKTPYKISASMKINGIEYKGQQVFKIDTFSSYNKERKYYLNLIDDTVKLVLNAVSPQRKIDVIVYDAENKVVNTADVCLFNSSLTFATRNCANAIYSKPTDVEGKTSFTVAENGTYYVYAQKQLFNGNDTSQSIALDTIVINDNEKREPVKLFLQKVTITSYKIELNIFDSLVNEKNAIPAADVCLFKSRQLFNTQKCANANYSKQSDADGKVVFAFSDTGKYFVLAQKTYYTATDTFTITALDSIKVNDPAKALHLK